MVEGHSVHRVASLHRKRLIGKQFQPWSPNGRFRDGAKAINNKYFQRIEAVGKNLFAFFFGADDKIWKDGDSNDANDDVVVVHVHFGMAGNWAVYNINEDNEATIPAPTNTNRLRLECPSEGIVADLSAMTVQYGTINNLYVPKRCTLGEDPLRHDANPSKLWERVSKSRKSIGTLIMDQSYFTGPGNIYRCEILFKSGIHPNRLGNTLTKSEFSSIWYHTVALLKRGYETGSIVTVDIDEAKSLGKPNLRRYVYNTSKCPRCNNSIKVWQIAARTCYACIKCQPLHNRDGNNEKKLEEDAEEEEEEYTQLPHAITPQKAYRDCVPFNSHCARESVEYRLRVSGPSKLTIEEIKRELVKLGVDISRKRKMKKADLVKLLDKNLTKEALPEPSSPKFISSEDAAAEKAAAGESLALEHIAELAPIQARKARAKARYLEATAITETDEVVANMVTPIKQIKRPKRKTSNGNNDVKRAIAGSLRR